MILFKFDVEDTGNCRVYYRGDKQHLYCIQNDGSWGKDKFAFYTCSRNGEPSYEIRMPLDTSFDHKIMPPSIETKQVRGSNGHHQSHLAHHIQIRERTPMGAAHSICADKAPRIVERT